MSKATRDNRKYKNCFGKSVDTGNSDSATVHTVSHIHAYLICTNLHTTTTTTTAPIQTQQKFSKDCIGKKYVTNKKNTLCWTGGNLLLQNCLAWCSHVLPVSVLVLRQRRRSRLPMERIAPVVARTLNAPAEPVELGSEKNCGV